MIFFLISFCVQPLFHRLHPNDYVSPLSRAHHTYTIPPLPSQPQALLLVLSIGIVGYLFETVFYPNFLICKSSIFFSKWNIFGNTFLDCSPLVISAPWLINKNIGNFFYSHGWFIKIYVIFSIHKRNKCTN